MLRTSYEDSNVLAGVLDLLALVFPSFREQEKAARRLGLRWEECSTPFAFERKAVSSRTWVFWNFRRL